MEKKLIKNLCALCLALTSVTSCVQGDFYEMYEDDDELIICRNKSSKDGMNLMNILGGGNYPVHVLSNYQQSGCLVRALNYTLGSGWVNNACDAIASTIASYSNHPDQAYRNKAEYLRAVYCNSSGAVDPNIVQSSFDDLIVFVQNYDMFGLQHTSSFSVGNLVVFKKFTYWGGPSENHSCCITSITNGGTMFVDNDGNQWSTEFIGNMYTKD